MAEARVERRFGDLWALKSFAPLLFLFNHHIALDEVRPQTAAPAAPATSLSHCLLANSTRTPSPVVFTMRPRWVDAVRCAIGIQRAMPAYNADLPQDKKIEFRIGILRGGNVAVDAFCTHEI